MRIESFDRSVSPACRRRATWRGMVDPEPGLAPIPPPPQATRERPLRRRKVSDQDAALSGTRGGEDVVDLATQQRIARHRAVEIGVRALDP